MTALPARFASHLASLGLPDGPVAIAVSGGPDSVALLHLMVLATRQPGLDRLAPLIVAHVDHGIHPESGSVATRVEQCAAALGVPGLIARLGLPPATSETVAREARYGALHSIARERDALLFTAHHRDDQVETVLLRVLGGSGPAGLAGMQPVSGVLVRPLLPFSRAEIRDWLGGLGVETWEDPANADPRHLRSWLRTRLMPLIAERIPDVDHRIERLARLARQNRAAWDAALAALRLDLHFDQGSISLPVAALAEWPGPLASMVLQTAARRAGLVLGPVAARRVLDLAVRGQSGQRTDLGAGLIAERAFDRVILGPAQPPALWKALIQGERGEASVDRWRFFWETDHAPDRQGRAGWSAWLTPGSYEVRPWRAGDRILPLGGTGRRLVVRCMQEAQVARNERSGWPIVVHHDDVVWVPGIMRSAHAVPKPGTISLRVEFRHAKLSK